MLAVVERRQIIRDGGPVGVHVEIRVAQCVGGIKADLAQRGHLICGQRHVIVPRDEEKADQCPVVLQTIDTDDILLDKQLRVWLETPSSAVGRPAPRINGM